jgi:hypothetical protein
MTPSIKAIAVNALSSFDAGSTLVLVGRAVSTETNPIMASLINHSYIGFFVVKAAFMLFATLVCLKYHQKYRTSRWILSAALVI